MPLNDVAAFDLRSAKNGSIPKITLNSGHAIPIVGLGVWALDKKTCKNSVAAALRCGIRLIDTAALYGNEAEVGEAIRESGIPREEIFVITKLWPATQFAKPREAIDLALKKLGIGYIDMMLLHHPAPGDVKAYEAIEAAIAAKKVRSAGLSNWSADGIERFARRVTVPPALVQNEINPLDPQTQAVRRFQGMGVAVQAWYPFGGRENVRAVLGDATIAGIAKDRGVAPAQVVLRWHLQRGTIVIPGSSDPEHIRQNAALFGFELSPEEMEAIGRVGSKR